jgi:hypothetical protein
MQEAKAELKRRLDKALAKARGETRLRKTNQTIQAASDGLSVFSGTTSVYRAKMSPLCVRELTRRYEDILVRFGLAGDDAWPFPMAPALGSGALQAPSVTSASAYHRI